MSIWGALAGGFIGTLVLTTALRTANELGLTRVDLPFLLGPIGYSRLMHPRGELAASKAYVEKKVAAKPANVDAKGARKLAYEDLIWVLINTKEFSFNH